MNSLIPDLPEEIGLECLIRVPHQSLPLLRRVCPRWKQTTESPLFHHLRRSANSSHHLIIFSQLHLSHSPSSAPSFKYPPSPPSFRLASLHLSSGAWSTLPLTPFFPRGLPLLCGLAASGLHLIIIGGWEPDTFTPSNAVYVYSFLSATWRRGNPMPGPSRSFFACSASPTNHVFVAGGHDVEKNALKSAMVYDIAKDEWTMLPEMARERDECTGVFDAKSGIFRVVGGYPTLMQGRFERSAEVFDVAEWRWGAVEEEAVLEGECSNTCVVGGDGRIYVCGGVKKAVLVKQGDEWREMAELPEDVRVATKMVALVGGLMVVGSTFTGGAQAAYVLEMKQGAAAAGWRGVEIPKEYSGHVQNACCVDI